MLGCERLDIQRSEALGAELGRVGRVGRHKAAVGALGGGPGKTGRRFLQEFLRVP